MIRDQFNISLGATVNPTSTKGGRLFPPNNTGIPDFQTFRRPCIYYIVRKMVAAIYARILFARAAHRILHTLLYILWQKRAFFHFGTQFFTFGFFCTSSIFLFGLRRRRHSVCTLNATIGSSILSEIFGNHKLSYYILPNCSTESRR